MSINQTRKLMEKKGCSVLLGIVGLLLGFAFVTSGSCNGMPWNQKQQAEENQPKEVSIVSVKDSGFSYDEFDQAFQNLAAQEEAQYTQQLKPGQVFEGLPVIRRAGMYMQVAAAAPEQATLRYMAKDRGVDLSETGIRNAMAESIKISHEITIADLRKLGKIKPNATQADIDKALKESGAQPLEEQLKTQQAQLDQKFRDPNGAKDIVAYATGFALMLEFRKDIKLSDADLIKTYESLTLKTLEVAVKPGEKETLPQKADRIVKEIKAGTSFEAAVDKYSAAIPRTPGGKLSQETLEFSVQKIDTDPALAPLKSLKPGEVSAPITTNGGTTIFKLVSKSSNLPKDFAAGKESYRLKKIMELASSKLMEALETTKKLQAPVWASPSYELLAKLPKTLPMMGTPKPEERKNLITVWDEALKLAKAGTGDRPAIYASYIIGDVLWRGQKPEQRKDITDRYIETLKLLFTIEENAQVRLDLADLLLEKKDPEAVEQLSAAARANGSFGPQGQSNTGLIFKMLDKLKAAKIGNQEAYAQIEATQSDWLKNKKIHDDQVAKDLAEQKKAEEEAAKRLKEEEAKAKAEAAKEKAGTGEAAPKADAPKGPSSSDLTQPQPTPGSKP